MTSRQVTTPPSGGGPHSEHGNPAYVRKIGRTLIIGMYSATRSIKLYPPEHTSVQRALEDVANVAREIGEHEQELEFRVSGEFIFLNETRLRLDLTNYASFGQVLTICKASGVGAIHVSDVATPNDWLVFLNALDTPLKNDPQGSLERLIERLRGAGVTAFELEPPSESDTDREASEQVHAAAVRTYAQSVTVTKEVMNSIRIGKTPSLKKIKRLVQAIVDQILNNDVSLLGLTTIRDYDEYTFTHSVNVCIFSVALGRRLGFTKRQLFDLGMAGLFHDIGKSRIPIDMLRKTDGLTDEEWRLIMAHPWLGVLGLFQMRGQAELPFRAMVVAYEHHMKCDLSGYPKPIRPRQICMTAKIVAVTDGYDAATSRRSYQTEPLPPPAVLEEMRDNPRRGMDPVVVKAFINLVGIYPVGTLVVLDTFELAIVQTANANPELLARPVVMVVSDPLGHLIVPPAVVDLAEQNPDGSHARTIIKTADPERYGIRVGDYFL
ncbi:MAG: HD-GYP domain-containing protein [Gemmatimonadaceae bacterium]